MNIQRAKEIAESPDMKNVQYNGQRVYIQHVDDQNATARVYPLNDPEHEQEVNVDNLIEQ